MGTQTLIWARAVSAGTRGVDGGHKDAERREADFITAQDATVPRGPVGPAARQYLLAGLLACARCGRRLESAGSNCRPAYRCRHGYISAVGTDPGRPRNTYVREDQILPSLAAVAILLAGDSQAQRSGTAQVTAPAETADLIDRLRASGAVLIYDPQTRKIRSPSARGAAPDRSELGAGGAS